MLRPNPEHPALWIVAGPNGSGKSTLYSGVPIDEFDQSIWIINPDLLARHIAQVEHFAPEDANLQSVIRIEAWLRASVAAYQTIGVETVLSTPKYRPLVTSARKKGFEVRLIYVVLNDVSKNIERVHLRVLSGGHDVPEDKIITRYQRSLRQLPWFLKNSDRAWVFDNSGPKPEIIATKQRDVVTVYPSAFPAIRNVLAPRRLRRQIQRPRKI